MAKTPLFARLRALASRDAQASEKILCPDELELLSRRAFVARTAGGVGALVSAKLLSACGSSDSDRQHYDASARVVIVGGGMAGLHCAYRLKQAGMMATVYESSSRTGGRMFSEREGFNGQVAELGGELIDTDHVTMHSLAQEFGIELVDRDAGLPAGTIDEVWWVDGKAVPDEVIVAQFSQVAPLMKSLADDESKADELDQTPMSKWLDDNLKDQPELKSVLINAYRGEYGLEVEEQSVLNLLYLIGSDDPDPFRIFGSSDERYHARTGSQTFPEKLAEQLTGHIETEQKLVKLRGDENKGYVLTFQDRAGELREVEADFVVLALPFTKLRQVELSGVKLSEEKDTLIRELGYGTNAKVMGAFTRRVWLEDHHASGSVTSDEPFQQCWDTSLGETSTAGLLTNFLGGKQGVASGQGEAEAWYGEVMLKGAEKVFPGVTAAYGGHAVRMHWPSYEHNLGSYACYQPGQWALSGNEGTPECDGTLLFCGEHTSVDFQGYMEGAAESGALAAASILEAVGLKPAEVHQALVRLKRSVPQPMFGERVTRFSLPQRRTALRAAMRDSVLAEFALRESA